MPDYPIQGDPTPFSEIFNAFFGKITDDMYLEWTKEDTEKDVINIFYDAQSGFEFPRFPLYDCTSREEIEQDPSVIPAYNCHLTQEEINIFALLMVVTWLNRQINSIEITRQKYSGSDFKFTSQANHLAKLLELKTENRREAFHMQRLYKRRKLIDNKGSIKSNWSTIMESSTFDG